MDDGSLLSQDYESDDYDDPFAFFNDEDGVDYSKKRKRKKSYSHSKVISSSNKAKKNIKRHGILISSNKEAKKRDEKTIKAFLKDFIPGDSKWEKAYREEILKRWMTMYVISKKAAKRLAKSHKNKRHESNGRSILNKEDAVNITRRLFQTAVDPFYDPTR